MIANEYESKECDSCGRLQESSKNNSYTVIPVVDFKM